MSREENPECNECGAEIVAALSVVGGFAPWLCLECSGATLADFVDPDATTCGIPVSEIIEEGGLYCLNCNEWRRARRSGDVEDCPNCADEGWNLYEDADAIVP